MDSRIENLTQFANALPEQFQFYHLGEVVIRPVSQTFSNDSCGVLFQLSGDLKALMVILFEKGLDASIYSELGNILASKITNYLSAKAGIDLIISPPQSLDFIQISQILKNDTPKIHRSYMHNYQNKIIPVEAIIVDPFAEEIGHA